MTDSSSPDAPAPDAPAHDASAPDASASSEGWFSPQATLPYVLPMVVYMLLGSFEPTPPLGGQPGEPGILGLTYKHYPAIYSVKLLVTIGVLALCWQAWGQWPRRVSPLAWGVGVLGAVLWIGISHWHPEGYLLRALGEESLWLGPLGLLGFGPRVAFNPFEHFGDTPLCYAFLVVRFAGLALVVPLLEELMLRGWLMRNVVSPLFWRVEFGRVTTQAVIVGTALPMLYHPEKVASLVWFTLVTCLMIRTRNFWDCVVAHGVTNLLLGLYVVKFAAWELW